MAPPTSILIVGGGIARLTLAIALRRHDLAVDIVERTPRGAPVGGGIAVQPNAMRVLHTLGVGAAVERAGTTIHRWQFRDRYGDVLCDIPLEPLWRGVGPFIGVDRTALHETLMAGAAPDASGC